jgi:thiamine biosynthesis protein ThiS
MIPSGFNLAQLANANGLPAEKIIIEYNEKIIPNPVWEQTRLQANDRVELVSFVGGG